MVADTISQNIMTKESVAPDVNQNSIINNGEIPLRILQRPKTQNLSLALSSIPTIVVGEEKVPAPQHPESVSTTSTVKPKPDDAEVDRTSHQQMSTGVQEETDNQQ